MNRSIIISLIFLIIIVIGGWLILDHKKNTTSTSTTTSSNNSSTMNMGSSNSGSSSSSSTSSTVTIANFAFSPAAISVKKGATVTWTNKDSTTHTVTEADGLDGPNSGDLSPNNTYKFTYNTVGVFHYHCTIHSNMTGQVTVTD